MTDYPVRPGAEPAFFEGGDIGCLVSHGFTGSPQSTRYLARYLAEEGGLSVSLPRLPGHGTAPEDMARSTARDWTQCIHDEVLRLNQRCRAVFTIGLSMGGTLALHAAASYPEMVRGVVSINAPVFIKSADLAGLAYAPNAPEFVPGIGSDIKRPDVDELSYDQLPVACISQLFGLVYVTQNLLRRLECPLLAMRSDEDHVVLPENADFLMDKAATSDKTLLRLHDSYHVATVDNDRDYVAEETLRFIRRIAG